MIIQSKIIWDQDIEEIRGMITNSENTLLNELLFVRIISSLEVYLVESIKDIFILYPKLFCPLQKEISFYYGEIFSISNLLVIYSKVLSQETKKLSRIGFSDVSKYYDKLGIKLVDKEETKSKMEMYHEIRNLIVHRLGEVDHRFKKSYNYHHKKIVIDNDYLFRSLDFIDEFVNKSNQKFIDFINIRTCKKKKKKQTVVVEIWFDRKSNNEIVNADDFIFRNGDDIFFRRDIEVSRENKSESVVLVLQGSLVIINTYLRRLETEATTKDNFHFQVLRKNRKKNQKKRNYNRNVSDLNIDKIKQMVGESRTSMELSRKISMELNLSGKQVKSVMNKIVKERIKEGKEIS